MAGRIERMPRAVEYRNGVPIVLEHLETTL
jgi:hypothetical protein